MHLISFLPLQFFPNIFLSLKLLPLQKISLFLQYLKTRKKSSSKQKNPILLLDFLFAGILNLLLLIFIPSPLFPARFFDFFFRK
jgi:hypothetical protein